MTLAPIRLEVLVHMPSSLEMGCHSCSLVMGDAGLNRKQRAASVAEYPEDLKETTDRLCRWLGNISALYQHRLRVRVIDPLSPLGIWKQLRHGVRRFPAFIVDRRHTLVGWDADRLESIIDRCLQGMG